ncbi:MAG: TraB/GumN family protein [Treponema sp.]|jgi:uncharacterized protein YbaP (TraB family)|nr:TraB/GumN family protein [Treponema sp.]
MKKILSFLIFSCFLCICSYGKTSLWKIYDGDRILYLGGTIHLLRESDYPLPEAFHAAFDASGVMVFECPNNAGDISNSEPFQAFLNLVSQIAALIQDEPVKSFLALAMQFQTAVYDNERVYNSISDPSIQLQTAEESEMRVNIINMALEIQRSQGNEQIMEYMELNRQLLAMLEDEQINMIIGRYILSDNRTLQTVLDRETFNALRAKCEEFDYPVTDLMVLKPYVAYTVLSLHLVGRFAQAQGVDNFFKDKSIDGGDKNIEYFESDEFQLDLITNLGDGYGNAYYSYLFQNFGSYEENRTAFDTMVECWKNGIQDSEEDLQYEYLRENFPAVYEALIKNRNNAWMPVIENYLKTQDIEFILVGNGHMYGPDGLLTQLEERGYRIEQQ